MIGKQGAGHEARSPRVNQLMETLYEKSIWARSDKVRLQKAVPYIF